jgi:hypothetical protein
LSSKQGVKPLQKTNGELISDDPDGANRLNDFFSFMRTVDNGVIPVSKCLVDDGDAKHDFNRSVVLRVIKQQQQLKSNNEGGSDDLLPLMPSVYPKRLALVFESLMPVGSIKDEC